MFEIEGKYTKATILTDYVEPEALGQIQTLCNQEFAKDSKICIMPDVHAGKGCVIGLAMEVKNKVVPNLVGVDIGCGVLTVPLYVKDINLKALDEFIRKHIPSGFNVYSNDTYKFEIDKQKRAYQEGKDECEMILNTKFRAYLDNKEHLYNSIGTLGGGNHFIEVDVDEKGFYYLVIHTGSRNLGVQVCNYHQLIANGHCVDKNIPKQLSYLESENMNDYLEDVFYARKFAEYNRQCIAVKILDFLGIEYRITGFDTIHNYIDNTGTEYIIRKGCVSALEDEELIIPINMRDGSLICRGKGNDEYLNTAPHGAGRIMSRGKAKEQIQYSDFVESMKGIYSSSVTESNLDESPFVYKDMETIKENIKDLVNIETIIKPIYNFKN